MTYDVSVNPVMRRRQLILSWKNGAVADIVAGADVLSRGKSFQALGVKPKDALHLASALEAGCDWFLTTDRGILKKLQMVDGMKVANPIDFIMTEDINA